MYVFAEDSDVLRVLLEHIPVAVALFDEDMRYLGCSQRWLDDYGLAGTALIGRWHYEVFPEIDDHWRDIHRRVLAGESLSSEFEPFLRSNATTDWVKWDMYPWRRAGKVAGAVLITEVQHDLVRDRQAALSRAGAAEATEVLLRSILDTVPEAMITIDDHGAIQSFSAAAERLFGYACEDVLGRNVAMLMPAPDAAQHDGYLANYRTTGKRSIIGATRRVIGRRKDGSTFPHELNVGEAQSHGVRVFTGFLRDLTAEEEAESRLRELQSELIHISRVSAVGTMATALAHELNQPLTAIANYVQTSAALMAEGLGAPLAEVGEALEEAGREALRAGAIIHRLRDFVARGELERAAVAPHELATQACALGAVGGKSRGIRCEIAMPPDLPLVLVDRVQLQQVLINLIRNAFEALGDRGAIIVGARLEGAMVHMSVTDDGPGVPAERLEAVFEPFISGKASGMGLGLAICRTIIEAHGGRLWVEPASGGGAAFHFTLPVDGLDAVAEERDD